MKVVAGIVTAVCMVVGMFFSGFAMLIGLNGFTSKQAEGAMVFGGVWTLLISGVAIVASVLLTGVFARRFAGAGAPVLAILISVGGAAVLGLVGLIAVAMIASASAR